MGNLYGFEENLQNISDQQAQKLKLLPLSHNSDIYVCQDIIRSGVLKPELCDVFNEEIIYFFYGLPIYSKENWAYPVFFFIKSSTKSLDIKSVYPTDTGGLVKEIIKDRNRKTHPFDVERVKNYLRCTTDTDDYHIISRKLIKFFFGNYENYLKGNFIVSEKDVETIFAREYLKLGDIETDYFKKKRAKAVEVHNYSEIKLEVQNLEYIIVPEEYLEILNKNNRIPSTKVDTYPQEVRGEGLDSIIKYAQNKFSDRVKIPY